MTKNIGDSVTLSGLHDVVMHPDKTYLLGKEGDCIYKTNVPDTITLKEGTFTWPVGTVVTISKVLYARPLTSDSEYVLELT